MESIKKKAYLTLQSGEVFQGYSMGVEGDATGEIVFTSDMVGYIENLTDPCNYGKILMQTFPLIGNYGMISSDAESDRAWISAYVVRELCDAPSNFRAEETLNAYLKKQGVVGICGVDTRRITKILREKGTMNARISTKPLTQTEASALLDYTIGGAVRAVAPKQRSVYGERDAKYTVVFWNFGAKSSTIKRFTEKNCRVVSMPSTATAEEILRLNPDGVVLSDGPGEPTENPTIIEEIKTLLGKKPVYGLGLGHQLVALALGAKTQRQKYGHRGGNQPVKCARSGRVYISSQNHGYEIVSESVKQGVISFVNVNDGSCEGIDYDELNAFTTQFSPECCGVGCVENPLYGKFFAMMDKEKKNA